MKNVFPKATVLKLAMTYPLPTGLIRQFAAMVDKIFVVWLLGGYDVSDSLSLFAEAVIHHRDSEQLLASTPFFSFDPSGGAYIFPDGEPGIPADNYYNPFGVDIRWPQFVQRRFTESDGRRFTEDVKTQWYVAGARGTVGESTWNWEFSVEYGRNDTEVTTQGEFRADRLQLALGHSGLDAAGNIVCSADPVNGIVPEASIIPGCLPMNLFGGQGPGGKGTITREMLDYTTAALTDQVLAPGIKYAALAMMLDKGFREYPVESKHRPTVYVPVSEFRKLIRSETGIAYGRSSAELTSFVTKDAIYRHTWEVAKPDELLEATTKSGLQPSATWSRIARQLLPYSFPKSRGHKVLFRNAGIDVLGGWQWSMPIMAKNATQYDINKAYQWSLLSHVSFEPDIKVYEGYRRNADICIVRCRFNPVYPMPPITRMAKSETLVAISPWDLERYNAQVVRCYWSICFQHPDPERLLHCMDRVADWPSEWRDHILRVAWASFAAPRVLPLREAPRGITLARQKWVSAELVTVLLELDGSVAPGAYAIVLEDPAGGRTKPLSFTVTR